MGGSCGSCLTLRAEDVTEEERDEPPWRWPLTQNKMIVKQTDKKKNELERGWKERGEKGKINKCKKEKNGDKKKGGKME